MSVGKNPCVSPLLSVFCSHSTSNTSWPPHVCFPHQVTLQHQLGGVLQLTHSLLFLPWNGVRSHGWGVWSPALSPPPMPVTSLRVVTCTSDWPPLYPGPPPWGQWFTRMSHRTQGNTFPSLLEKDVRKDRRNIQMEQMHRAKYVEGLWGFCALSKTCRSPSISVFSNLDGSLSPILLGFL